VLREAVDLGSRGDFHEEALAKRMHAPVEEIRKHLQLLADIGLVSEAP
jgi:transcription initiation factor IIE alpha subunit